MKRHQRFLIPLLVLLLATWAGAQETVHLQADDGQPLTGTFSKAPGAPQGGVLLLHMYRTSRISFAPLAARLAAQGFDVLALDMRGHGDSVPGKDGEPIDIGRDATKDPRTNPFLQMHRDAEAGLDLLVARGAPADRLAIIGASVGASVALHTAALLPRRVAAIVLLTPGSSYLGVPSTEHATRYGERPALILSSEEEADQGARPIAKLMKDARVDLRVYPEKRIHGTQMFGKVPGVEAEIITWLRSALVPRLEIEIPYDKHVLLDGEFGPKEAPRAHRIQIEVSKGRKGVIRISHGQRMLYVGFDLHERCMRQNGVEVFLNAGATGPSLPDESCFRLTFAPRMGAGKETAVYQGDNGAWKQVHETFFMAQAVTGASTAWSCELAISLKTFLRDAAGAPLRIAFQVNGAVDDDQFTWPGGENVRNAPRTWMKAILGKEDS